MTLAAPGRPLDMLVLGGSGFIGRRILNRLGDGRSLGTYRSQLLAQGMRFDAGRDDPASVLAAGSRRFSHAVILYGIADPELCARDPIQTARINVDSIVHAASAAQACGAIPVFVSSDYVFDGTRGGWSETDTPVPRTVYGGQKRAVERWLERSGGPYLIVRLSKVVDGDTNTRGVLGQWVNDIRAGRTMRCAADQFFSPTWADDVAEALVRLAEAGATGTYHLAAAQRISRLVLLRMLVGEVGAVDPTVNPAVAECSLRDLPFAECRPLDTSLDSSKLDAAIGWRFKPMQSLCAEVAAIHFARRPPAATSAVS